MASESGESAGTSAKSLSGSRQFRGRSAARLAAVQALYEMELAEVPPDPVLDDLIAGRWAGGPEDAAGGESRAVAPDPDLLRDVVLGVSARRERLDALVGPALAAGWTVARLETILLLILRAGVYELLERKDVPPPVVISEYVDVARAFFFGNEPGLVNAVLDRLARELRPAEMGGPADGPPADHR
jgi:N utilization substance protein B